MTTTRPYAPATSKNLKKDRILGEDIFAALIVVLFLALGFGLKMDWIPAKNPGHPFDSFSDLYLVILVVFFWVVLSDRT